VYYLAVAHVDGYVSDSAAAVVEQQVSGLERRNERLAALIRKSDRLLMQNHQILMDSLGEE
jgi:hypothetical protein